MSTPHLMTPAQRSALDDYIGIGERWINFFQTIEPTESENAFNAAVSTVIAYAYASRATQFVHDYSFHLHILDLSVHLRTFISNYVHLYAKLLEAMPNRVFITVHERIHWLIANVADELIAAEDKIKELSANPAPIINQLRKLGINVKDAPADTKADPSVGINDFFTAGTTKQ